MIRSLAEETAVTIAPRQPPDVSAAGVDIARPPCYPHRLTGGRMPPEIAVAIGCVAQLVEQLTLNQRVQGSNPCTPTNDLAALDLATLD